MIAVAAIPAKDFANAKRRLSGLLAPPERAALARAMLEDVLSAVCAAPFQSVCVVTRDPDILRCARQFPVDILKEQANRGHSEAVGLAQAGAVARGADAFVTVPGDVPAVTASELSAILAAADRERAAVFVPSVSGYGTNGVLLRPPDVMTLKFGEPSFANHLSAARARDLAPEVLHLPGLALDIDTPDDLRAFLDTGSSTRTGRLLVRLGVRARLRARG